MATATGKPKQGKLPGLTSEVEEKLEELAQNVYDLQTKRLQTAKEEEAARTELLDFMKANKIKGHEIDDELEVVRESQGEKAYVRRKRKKRSKAAASEESGEE